MKLIQQMAKQSFLQENRLTLNKLNRLFLRHQNSLSNSFNGSTVALNISSSIQIPMIAFSFPRERKSKSNVIVIVLCPAQLFVDSFGSGDTDLVESFMVDTEGRVIVHHDMELVLKQANFNKLPIVVSMQKSQLRSGQISYVAFEKEYLGSFWKSSVGGLGVISTVRKEDAFAEVYNIQRRNIYLMIAALNLAILAVFLYSRRVIGPIKRLTHAAEEIGKGSYNINLPITARDEIGLLTSTFNTMNKGLQERQNLMEALRRFVNTEIVERSLQGSLELGGKTCEAALLFCDIRNFTSMSEKMQAEDVVRFLNSYLSEMIACIIDTKGTVDKFIGDAVMAHWGALEIQKTPVDNAIRAALNMRKTLLEYNKKHRSSLRRENLRFGIGINYGLVVAGQIGSSERFEYTVIGDAVNIASRLEGLTKELKVDILITEETLENMKDAEQLSTKAMGNIRVKGKAKPLEVHTVLGWKHDVHTPTTVAELRKLTNMDI